MKHYSHSHVKAQWAAGKLAPANLIAQPMTAPTRRTGDTKRQNRSFAQNYAKKRCKRRLETKPRFLALAGSCGCSDSIVLPCAFTLMPWAASSPIGQNGFTKMRRVAKTRHVATRE